MSDAIQTTVSVLRYGPHAEQIADLRLPVSGPAGSPDVTEPLDTVLLVIIHGGDWQHAATREYLNPMAESLTALGYAVVSLEYRRLGGGGGWPATFEDIVSALEAIPALARERAAEAGLALDAIVLIGHSAGGQLALWAAAQPVAADPSLAAVIALGATADLGLAHELNVGSGAVAELVGGAPADVPEVMAQADPIRLRPRVPVRLLHVSKDPVVPAALSRAYAADVGGDVGYRELPGDSHFSFTTPGEMDWAVLVETIEQTCRTAEKEHA